MNRVGSSARSITQYFRRKMMRKNPLGIPQIILDIFLKAKKGDFSSDGSENAVGNGEKVISEMTLFEKACYVIAFDISKKLDEKRELGASIEDHDVQSLLKQAKMIDDLKWFSIVERLGEKYPSDIGIRKGWQIVETSGEEEKNCNCPICRAERQSSIPDGIMVIEVSMSEGKPESGMMGNLLSRIFNDPTGIFARRG